MKPVLTALNRMRASDSVYQNLRDCILSQAFHPGERLNVKELAAALNVSLTPVKEAINRLAIEGLVAINPRSGTYVTEISPAELAETFELRVALECLAVEKCAKGLTEDDLLELGRIIEKLNAPVSNERERKVHEQNNYAFHNRIVALSGNQKLIDAYRGLNAHITIARIHYSREGWESRIDREREEHNEIFDALSKRDGQRAVRLLRRHIERASESLIDDLERNGNTGLLHGAKAS